MLERHPLSAAFPDMPADEFAALVADIEKNGQREQGWLYEGKILDGWNRYLACKEVGAVFRHEHYRGNDPVSFVVSRNVMRRHLSASQRAAAVVACHEWFSRGKPSKGVTAQADKAKSAPGADLGATTAQMAKEAQVGTRTIEQAKAAQDAGLGKSVRDGAMTAKKAAAVAAAAAGKTPRKKKAPQINAKDRRIAELEAENVALKDEIEQVREGAAEAVRAAETAAALLDTEPAKVLLKYKAEISRLERLRDDLMNQNGQMVRQVKVLQRKLDRLERAAA